MYPYIVDSHVHTNNSPDGSQTIDSLCTSAIDLGIQGVAICDHAHMHPSHQAHYGEFSNLENIKKSISDADYAKERYKGKLEVFRGVEMGEYLYDKAASDEILSLCDYDVIIGSVHHVCQDKWGVAYNQIPFSDLTDKEITWYLNLYFDELLEMIEKLDFDILAHPICPLRYINVRHKRDYDISVLNHRIDEVLKAAIGKNLAIELNTRGIAGVSEKDLRPETDLIRRYRELGGRYVTIGTDAHGQKTMGRGLDIVFDILRKAGFDEYFFFEKRKRKAVSI